MQLHYATTLCTYIMKLHYVPTLCTYIMYLHYPTTLCTYIMDTAFLGIGPLSHFDVDSLGFEEVKKDN